VLLPPRISGSELEDVDALDPEALIREARARQQRRRIRAALALAAGVAAAAAVYGLVAREGRTQGSAAASGGGAVAARRCPPGNLGTVAFLRGGSLELLDLHGCRTRTLVRAHAAPPVQLSADGRWAAFGGGFVSTRGGAVHRTTGAGTWSPRADVLAVGTKRGGLELVRPDGRTSRLLPDGWGVLTVAFSPDGRTLAVSRSLYKGPATPWRSWHQEIWTVDVATGARRELFDLGAHALAPAWLQGFSPDGRTLLFWEDVQNSASIAADGIPLVALPVAGGKPVTITKGELHYPDFLTWCGNTLVYVIDHGGRLVTYGDGIATAAAPLWRSRVVLPAGGGTSWNSVACPTAAAAAKGGGGLVVAGGPASSRDLNLKPGAEHRSLWMVAPTAGARPVRIPQAVPPQGRSDELPMWSGDGRWLLFVRTTHTGRGALYALDPFGGNLIGPIAPVGTAESYYGAYGWALRIDWHR
jgi:sugar lactone lactonase YvrE